MCLVLGRSLANQFSLYFNLFFIITQFPFVARLKAVH